MDSLWKKESNAAGSAYINIFDREDDEYSIYAAFNEYERFDVKTNSKSEIFSTQLRNQGNEKFLEGNNWNDAMELYNKSLCFAEIESESETISLAFANRSACFLELKMYEKCLIDIELAITANYPKRLMPKLEARRADCLEKLQKDGGPVEFVPKLSFAADKHFPEMAEICKIECNDEYGRFIVATTDVDVGETVLIESTFSSRKRTTKLSLCETCSKQKMNFIPCKHCTNEMFCNNDCMESNDYHRFVEHEENCSKDIKHEFDWLFTAVKMFRNAENLMEFVEYVLNEKRKELPLSTTSMKSKFREFLKLSVYVPPARKKLLLSLAVAAYKHISNLKFIKMMFRDEGQMNFLMHLILHHTFVSSSNSFTRLNDCGLFILSSYLNHSCVPNLAFSDCGSLRIGTILRPINKGQQLFATYLGEDRRAQPAILRQTYLITEFGFKCRCDKCKFDLFPHKSFLLREPDYHYLEKEFAKHPITKNESFKLRQRCIKLLNKFGNRQWHMELENVAKSFRMFTHEMYNN